MILSIPGRRGSDSPTAVASALEAVTSPATARPFAPAEQIVAGGPTAPPLVIDGADVGIDAATGEVFAAWRQVGSPIGWSIRTPIK